MKITILIDNPKAWYVLHGKKLELALSGAGHDVLLTHDQKEVPKGDVLFLLSCGRIVKEDTLARNTHNIVIHGSHLPKDRGFAPMQYQILRGENEIHFTMIEAALEVDAGAVYMRDSITLEGHELWDEISELAGKKINEMALRYVVANAEVEGEEQEGEPSWNEKRKPEDSELDPDKTIAEQFDLLRIVDNDAYPAFFKHRGVEYELKIKKKQNE